MTDGEASDMRPSKGGARYDVLQIAGMLLLVLGGQGAVRMLFRHNDRGWLGWTGLAWPVVLVLDVLLVVGGALLAGWAFNRARAAGRRNGI